MSREADLGRRVNQPDLIVRLLGDFRANLCAAWDDAGRGGHQCMARDIVDPERPMIPLHSRALPVRSRRFVMSWANRSA
jgi:hypothetical protein